MFDPHLGFSHLALVGVGVTENGQSQNAICLHFELVGRLNGGLGPMGTRGCHHARLRELPTLNTTQQLTRIDPYAFNFSRGAGKMLKILNLRMLSSYTLNWLST